MTDLVTDVQELALADPGALAYPRPAFPRAGDRLGLQGRRDRQGVVSGALSGSGPLLPLLFPLPSGWPANIDAFQLRRVLAMTVRPADEPGAYVVTGGVAPHEVHEEITAGYECDCEDATLGHHCRYVLAVRMARGGPEVLALRDSLYEWPRHATPSTPFTLYSA